MSEIAPSITAPIELWRVGVTGTLFGPHAPMAHTCRETCRDLHAAVANTGRGALESDSVWMLTRFCIGDLRRSLVGRSVLHNS